MNTDQYNLSVETHSDGIFRFILKNLRDDEKSRDIVQDSFEKLWINRNNVDSSKVKSYLYTTAYHKMIDWIRREKKKDDFETVDVSNYSHCPQYTGLSDALDIALDRLPEIQKSLILLRDYEGYSYEEIGDITKLSTSQVKVYIYRARKKLKEFIGSIDVLI